MSSEEKIIANYTWLKVKTLLLCLFSLFLMAIDHRTEKLTPIRYVGSYLTAPLHKIAEVPSNFFSAIKHWVRDKDALIQEINALKKRELYLSYETQKMASLTAENNRLRLLLKSSVRIDEPTLIAKLVNISTDPYRHIITLNQGEREQITVNLAVLNSDGIIGQIIEANPHYSQAILITDPHHSLPVEINRNGVRGLAMGNGKLNQIDIRNISIEDDVRVGDLLVTSGLGGRFPHGYPVATITSIDVDSTGYFAKIIATPTANLDRIREVLVILNPQEGER